MSKGLSFAPERGSSPHEHRVSSRSRQIVRFMDSSFFGKYLLIGDGKAVEESGRAWRLCVDEVECVVCWCKGGVCAPIAQVC